MPNVRAMGAAARRRSLDPTRPERWPEQQERGRTAFLLQYGVLALGLPIAVVFDLLLLIQAGDLAIFFSAHHAFQLALMTSTIGPVVGLILGRMLWRIGERRYGDALLTRAFMGDDPAEERQRQRLPIGYVPVSRTGEPESGA
jgi:hypothetical protein